MNNHNTKVPDLRNVQQGPKINGAQPQIPVAGIANGTGPLNENKVAQTMTEKVEFPAHVRQNMKKIAMGWDSKPKLKKSAQKSTFYIRVYPPSDEGGKQKPRRVEIEAQGWLEIKDLTVNGNLLRSGYKIPKEYEKMTASIEELENEPVLDITFQARSSGCNFAKYAFRADYTQEETGKTIFMKVLREPKGEKKK